MRSALFNIPIHLIFVFIPFGTGAQDIKNEGSKLSGQELVDYVNNNQNLWTAKLNTADMRSSLGLVQNSANGTKRNTKLAESSNLDMELPKSFDPRGKWPMCKSLNHIRDQSKCGSCWAFAAVEVMSDRLCIATKGKTQVSLSANDLISCCSKCGHGCQGGEYDSAYEFYATEGLVTGSDQAEHQGCRPYPFPKCEHHNNHTTYPQCDKLKYFTTPKCEQKCQKSYKKNYKDDKYFGEKGYKVSKGVAAIQKELITHGPISAAFDVHEDFLHYEKGIYKHTGGKEPFGHAVKLMGWGEENGVPYWLIANSWNKDWGENGFFRIIRGQDECGIESELLAGLPKLKKQIA